jgi:hypothetical protein
MDKTEEEINKARLELIKRYKIKDNLQKEKQKYEKSLRERMGEDPHVYEQVKIHQKEAFFNTTIKRWEELKSDKELQKELWEEFWVDFVENRVYSIREFMEARGYIYPESANIYGVLASAYKNEKGGAK